MVFLSERRNNRNLPVTGIPEGREGHRRDPIWKTVLWLGLGSWRKGTVLGQNLLAEMQWVPERERKPCSSIPIFRKWGSSNAVHCQVKRKGISSLRKAILLGPARADGGCAPEDQE